MRALISSGAETLSHGWVTPVGCTSTTSEREVVGYFVEHGYLGVKVKLWYPPEWYVNQNTTDGICHVFGNELKPRKPKAEAA